KMVEIMRQVKEAAFVTVEENGSNQMRMIDVMLVENETLYFCTSRGKDFYRQLMDKGETAVVGMNREYQAVRLNGMVEKLEDPKYWIDRIFVENTYMN